MQLLHELAPAASAIAVMVNPTNANAETQRAQCGDGCARHRFAHLPPHCFYRKDYESAFARSAGPPADALLVLNDPLFFDQRSQITALAARYAVPVMYATRDYAEAGGLISYGANLTDAYRQVGVYVGRILKGEKPADLPVLLPTKFELVINLKTAKALGLVVPPTLLARADEVIE